MEDIEAKEFCKSEIDGKIWLLYDWCKSENVPFEYSVFLIFQYFEKCLALGLHKLCWNKIRMVQNKQWSEMRECTHTRQVKDRN
jgi:hypothetical protein